MTQSSRARVDEGGPLAALLPPMAVVGSITSLTIGTSFAKHLFPLVGAPGAIALRTGLAAVLLCAIWRPWRRRLASRDLAAIALYGAVLGIMNLLFYQSLRTIPLGIAIAIEFTGPLAVAIAGSHRALDALWIALAALGLALLLPLAGTPPLDPKGVAYAGCAAVAWALYIIVGQRAGRLPGGLVVSLGMSVAGLVTLPVGIAAGGAALLAPATLGLGLAVAILSSAIPYSLEMFALQRLPRPTFGILLSLEPAAGALAALAILGERLSASQWLAIGAIVVASIGSTATASRRGSKVALPAP